MKLIHDNDLVNVSAGMNSSSDYVTRQEDEVSRKSIDVGVRCAMGAGMGVLAGAVVGAQVGAVQFRKYVLAKGEKSSSMLGSFISGAVEAGCSVVGGVLGFTVGAIASI